MLRYVTALALLSISFQAVGGQLSKGEAIPSRFLGSSRRVQVYTPPSYEKEPGRRYPVLYLHDGQNVFSSAGTNVVFGWGFLTLFPAIGPRNPAT